MKRSPLLWFVSAMGISLLLAQGLLLILLTHNIREQRLQELRIYLKSLTQLLAGSARAADGPADPLLSEINGLEATDPNLRIEVLDSQGKVLSASGRAGVVQDPGPSPELLPAAKEGYYVLERYSAVAGHTLVVAASPLKGPAGGLLGYVRVSASLELLEDILSELTLGFWLSCLAVGLGVFFVALWQARRQGSELQKLVAQSAAFAQGEPWADLYLSSSPELRLVSTAFHKTHRMLEQKLVTVKVQRDELAAVLDGMVEAVVVLDTGLVVKSMNPSARRLFPTVAPPEGQSFIQVCRHSALDDLARTLASGTSPLRAEIVLADLQTTLQVQAASLADAGRSWGAVFVLSDMTQLKRLEVMRRDFVANVSHELKTPLTTIKGYVETLQEGALDQPEIARNFLAVIERHADRMALIVDDLLILSRIETSPPTEGELREVDLTELAAAVVQAYRDRAVKAKIRLKLKAIGSVRRLVFPLLLEQALGNLLDNALKFSPPKAVVTVAVRETGGRAELSVVDSGPGIPQVDQQRVFERFYRTESSRSTEGTGLGLAIVKHVVLLHRGTVTLASPPVGKTLGTKFRIVLP